MDFAKLKAMRGNNSLAALSEELNKLNTKTERKNDDRFWLPTVDKAGNGYAVIRFLPPPSGEEVPFVRLFDHGFQGPSGSWYIENSLTTLGKKDPVGEYNSQLWNSGIEADKEQARKQKRRLHFISNIYIVEDKAKPENEGKVFLYKYGKKIFDKLKEVMQPEFPDETPMNPFDMWTGANLALKIRQVEGYRNYDKSSFMAPRALASDDKLEKIYSQEYSLQEFLKPENFKSYEQLEEKLKMVLSAPMSGISRNAMEQEDMAPPPSFRSKPAAAPAMETSSDDDDDDMAFFEKLKND